MNTSIIDLDLTHEAPHSPRNRIGGFAIASRAVDKCRASVAGTLGEYHYDCPLDNVLFTFKGITGEQFKTAVEASKTYEEVGTWLLSHGNPKTPAEVKTWSDEVEAGSPMKSDEKRDAFIHNCSMLGLIPESSTGFDLLEADDKASFKQQSPSPKQETNGKIAASPPVIDEPKMYKTGNDLTRKMVLERAVELALIDGRSAQEASKSDWEQAKRELTGGSDMDSKELLLESASEEERWDPLPGSTGHIAPVSSIDGEDEDGRGFSERLIDQGMLEAEHDQMLQAAKKEQDENK